VLELYIMQLKATRHITWQASINAHCACLGSSVWYPI